MWRGIISLAESSRSATAVDGLAMAADAMPSQPLQARPSDPASSTVASYSAPTSELVTLGIVQPLNGSTGALAGSHEPSPTVAQPLPKKADESVRPAEIITFTVRADERAPAVLQTLQEPSRARSHARCKDGNGSITVRGQASVRLSQVCTRLCRRREQSAEPTSRASAGTPQVGLGAACEPGLRLAFAVLAEVGSARTWRRRWRSCGTSDPGRRRRSQRGAPSSQRGGPRSRARAVAPAPT